MIEYEITKVQDKIVMEKTYCLMFIKVNTNEISSTGFTIEFGINSSTNNISKNFIERKILNKIEQIKKIENRKKSKEVIIQNIREKFENTKGII